MAEAKRKQEEKGQETPGNEKKSLVLLEIERAKRGEMNVLIPNTHIEGISEFHIPVIAYVPLSPEPVDGDVYFHKESGKFALTKQGLMTLSKEAGIVWHPAETRRVDNRGDRDYVAYRAVGGIRMADGTIVWAPPGEYDMDFEVIEEKLRVQYEKSGKKAKKAGDELQGYIDYCVKRDLLHKRDHKIKLAAAGAMNRVVRMLLGLKPGYTKQELNQPFVVARIVFKPDYSDPQTKKRMIDKGIESLTSVYGAEAPFGEEMDLPPIDIPNGNSETSHGYEPEDQGNEVGNTEDSAGPVPDDLTNAEADFTASDASSQISTLKILAKRKGYDLKQLKRPLDKFTEFDRKGFFDKLTEMPDDDIPF
jgi:hypothetical protein